MADEMRAYDPTMRERMASALQSGMEGMGVNRYKARKHAQTIMGGESSNLPGGMGIADVVPFLGTGLQTEEAVDSLKKAKEAAGRGDLIDAGVEGAFGAIGLIPGAAGTAKAGKALVKKLKTIDLPKLKPIGTDSVPKKQSLQEWAMAGGGVPLSHKDRADVWHKKVQRLAAGGEVFNTNPDMSDGGQIIDGPAYAGGGGVKKIMKDVITSAAEKAGMKAPTVATKELTTLQDFHTSLGDRVRQGATEMRDLMESMPFKYEKGQRVFTEDSAKKNKPPYTIIERTLVGNQPMRADHPQLGPGLGKVMKDPDTGKAMRTPYEPGYRVRHEMGPDDWSEFHIPESAIKGDVELAKGGLPHFDIGGSAKREGKDIIKKGLKKLFGVADEAPKGVEPIVVRTPEERAVIEKFGQKHEQEAARAKKVEKLAAQEPTEAAKPAKSKGPRTKVEPDVYRKMAEEQGDEAVLKAARAGKHLKPTPTGYIGAPRTVTSPQGLGSMRKAMDKDFDDAVEAVAMADPERLGTWYDRAKQGIAESVEPYQLNRGLEQHGVYSAGVSPESELGFALKHLNSRVAGEPAMAYRGAPMRNLDTAVAEDRPANMGFKIGEYANKNDPRIPNEGLFGVNDFRRAQGMGYTDPQGNPWRAGVSETMHPFMDAETALQVDRANKAGIGGRTDWAGPHIQEVPWVYGKGQDLYSRGKKGRYAGDELEGIKSALQDANNTARDYFYKHAASATHEAVPGASLGHVRQALDMTPEEKLAYGQKGRWDMPPPEYALGDNPAVGAGNRDILYGAAGYRQLPSREASGLYINKLGGVETNPMTIARPLMDYPTGGGGLMAPESRKMADTLEQFRAFIDAQEAGAYNLPNTMAGVKGKNSMVLDARGRNPDKLADPSAEIGRAHV